MGIRPGSPDNGRCFGMPIVNVVLPARGRRVANLFRRNRIKVFCFFFFKKALTGRRGRPPWMKLVGVVVLG
jgi:hypothetical protein